MNHSDIRKHLKKGEQAVDVLESIGFKYIDDGKQHPFWQKPDDVLDPILESLKGLIAEHAKTLNAEDPRGPNWHLVEDMIGRDFKINQAEIPSGHRLDGYGSVHFAGSFKAVQIRYVRSKAYTGYVVDFTFNTRPFAPELVNVPLRVCRFRT